MDTKPIIDSQPEMQPEEQSTVASTQPQPQPQPQPQQPQPQQPQDQSPAYVNPLSTITSTFQENIPQISVPSITTEFTDLFSSTDNVDDLDDVDASQQDIEQTLATTIQEDMPKEDVSKEEMTQEEMTQEEMTKEESSKDLLDINLFEEGDSIVLISKNKDNEYHNKIVDFLYEDKGTLYLLDDDELFELQIKDNKIVTNENRIYFIQKKKDIKNSHENAFIVNELNLSIIESGVEIQERLLSEWEREWTEREYISSIIENVKKISKQKSYYELDVISKNLLELINDNELYSKLLLPDDSFNEDDNKYMIQKLYNQNFSNSFIKPIIIDKKKFSTNVNNVLSEDIYIEQGKDDIKIIESLQHRNYHPQADHYRSSLDSYEKELMIGNKETNVLDEDGNIEEDTISYINPSKAYINENIEKYSLEYHQSDIGLSYNTKVYRYHYPRYSLVINDSDSLDINFTDIETRYADSHYYRFYDQLDKRRITDTYGKLKATQICHGIKAETLFSDSIDERGRANIKKHKDSFFNKSISKLPKRNIYIEGEKILICGFVLHNTTNYSPTFVNSDTYFSDSGLLKINYNSGDYGYTLLDYIHQHKKNSNDPYLQVYDVNYNKAIYKNANLKVPSFYNINNFIYFNTHKSNYIKKITIDDEDYNLIINKQGRVIIHNLTKDIQEEPKDINDPSIPMYIINTLLTHKLIEVKEDIYKPVFKNINTLHYLNTIKNIVPTITDILKYESHTSDFLQTSNINDINKQLSKYELSYNKLPKKHRMNIKKSIADNIKEYKRKTIQRMKMHKKNKTNRYIIENVYNEIDTGISKVIKQRYYYKQFAKLNLTKEERTGPKPTLKDVDKNEEETETDYQERVDIIQRNYQNTLKKWNMFNEEYIKKYHNKRTLDTLFDTIKSTIKAKCNLYILNEQFVTLYDLEMFLDYISDNNYDKTKNSDRIYLISKIVDILYSRFDTIYYKNLFFNDISKSSYENFCKVQKAGQTTLYCSEQSLTFLEQYYAYNDLHIYDMYQHNSSTTLSKNNLQIIDMIHKCKQHKNYELLLDIYKNIQIERELVNIEKSYNRIITNSDSSISVEELLEKNKREFMIIRDSFNDEIKKTIYYDACYGFKIVKVYKKKYDLLSDNMTDSIYYDEMFDTTERDIDIINEYTHTHSIDIEDIDRPDIINQIYTHFTNFYLFSPEYEIKNIVHNAIENIRKMDISPIKNSNGIIIINKISDSRDRLLWDGNYFSLGVDGTMKLENGEAFFNINDLSKESSTIITTDDEESLEINKVKLLSYLDMLNIIHINKKNIKRPIVDGEYAILKNGTQRNIYKRINSKWIILNEENVTKEGTCLLEKYRFKETLSLHFDDLLLLNDNMIKEIEANPSVDFSSEPSSLQKVKDNMTQQESESESEKTQQLSELSGDVPIKQILESVQDKSIDTVDANESSNLEELGDIEDEGENSGMSAEVVTGIDTENTPEENVTTNINVIKESGSGTTDTQQGGDIFKNDLINLFGISENVVKNMEGGADVEEDSSLDVSKPIIEESFNGFSTCINTDFLPMDVQNIFTYPNDNEHYGESYLNVTVPKKLIKFIFTINKKFNLIKEMDHVIVDKKDLLLLLQKQNTYINKRLQILQKINEEKKIYDDTAMKKILSKKNKNKKIPTNIQQEFYSIFLIQDMDICLSTLKEFIEKYGIYNKPSDDIYDVYGEMIEDEIKQIDPERDPTTSKFIYWDPYFFPGVNEKMCCKHYIDLTNIAWLDNNSRSNMIEEIANKYAQKDHIEGGNVICKHCGEHLNYIKYSDQEGFGAEDKPIVFREKIEENEYNELLVSSDYSSQFFSKKILVHFLKSFNLTLTEEDTEFIEVNSYKTFKLYEKSQKEIYTKFLHELVTGKKIIDTEVLKKCKTFYSSLIYKNPQLEEIFVTNDKKKQKKIKTQYVNMFMSKYYKKINIKEYKTSKKVEQFLKFSDAILRQTKKYNTTIQIYTTMIYLIFIILYSNNHYKIISSGDARYTGQRVIIYDTEESLKEKCIDLSINKKSTSTKNNLWKHFVHNSELFESIYVSIYKYPDIQQLKEEKLAYNLLLEQKSETIQKTLEWNTFRPTLIPNFNYKNTTSMEELQTLVSQLQSTSSNIKKYKLLSHISEETRKLSLEHISKINNFIIMNKQIKNLNFVSYQSSCCDFKIQDSYQQTLSKELIDRTQDITILYDTIKQTENDYYLLHGFKGLNDIKKGRRLLHYLNMKNTLHNEYSKRKEDESYSITEKDTEYKSYLEKKIYKMNHYVVIEEMFDSDYIGYKRMFINVTDPDYQLLSELDVTDELESALKEKLIRKYEHIMDTFQVTSDQIDRTRFDEFINQKIKIIIEHDGETQKDLITGMYIYDINTTVESYVQDKTINELKIIADRLENYLEKKIKTKLILNINKSQQNKEYIQTRYKNEHTYNQLSLVKNMSKVFKNIYEDHELFINDSLFTSLYTLYNTLTEDDDDNGEDTYKLIEYNAEINNTIINILEIYSSFEVADISIKSNMHKFKNIYMDKNNLITMLGMNTDLENEIYKAIENDLIVQGYKKNSPTYNNELIYRKRNCIENLESDRILLYKESIKYMLHIYNKLQYFKYKDFTIEESNISEEEILIRDIFTEQSSLDIHSDFIDSHMKHIYELLDILSPKRNIYTVTNNLYIKSIYDVEIIVVLIKYIFVKVLHSFMILGYSLSGLQKTNLETLKNLLLFNISSIVTQFKNTDEIIQDEIIAYQKKQNDNRKRKFERMVNYDRENASIYLISRTINMGDVFTKRKEQNEALYAVNEEGGIAAFLSQEEGSAIATTEDMELYEQQQADAEVAQEFGMSNVQGEDDINEE